MCLDILRTVNLVIDLEMLLLCDKVFIVGLKSRIIAKVVVDFDIRVCYGPLVSLAFILVSCFVHIDTTYLHQSCFRRLPQNHRY